jgi:hypothetical protein
MTQPGGHFDTSDADRRRVSDEMEGWLRLRGVPLFGNESDEALVTLREAIERFEMVVQQHGGDLMVDEPVVVGRDPQKPDNRAFALPTRGDDESIAAYTARVEAAANAANQGPWS